MSKPAETDALHAVDITLMSAVDLDRLLADPETPDPMPGLSEHLSGAAAYEVR